MEQQSDFVRTEEQSATNKGLNWIQKSATRYDLMFDQNVLAVVMPTWEGRWFWYCRGDRSKKIRQVTTHDAPQDSFEEAMQAAEMYIRKALKLKTPKSSSR